MFDVHLYIYDLSFGLARSLSEGILGTRINGIWHTGIVVYGKEYFYGSHGISCCSPCGTPLGEPLEKQFLGQTAKSQRELEDYLEQLAHSLFKGEEYRLFDHNCNTFSNHIAGFLLHKRIPQYILDLPRLVESTPLGSLLKPAIHAFSSGLDNVPQFGMGNTAPSLQQNNHSFENILDSFRPIFFDEPLSNSLLEHRLRFLWPTETTDQQKVDLVLDLYRMATKSNCDEFLTPDHFSLLALDQLQTEDQCRTILELFRLIAWRSPKVVIAMLTDPARNLHRLEQTNLPTTKPENALDLYAAQAKFMTNCLGRVYTSPLAMENDQFSLPLSPLIHLALLLLDHPDHCLDSLKPNPSPIADHIHIGLALGHNLALCRSLSCEEALELGSYLIHLAVEQRKPYQQPIEAIYLLRSIYFLVIRFPLLADLGRASDLTNCLIKILEGYSTNDNHPAPSAEDGASVDYYIAARLLDFLTHPECSRDDAEHSSTDTV